MIFISRLQEIPIQWIARNPKSVDYKKSKVIGLQTKSKAVDYTNQ